MCGCNKYKKERERSPEKRRGRKKDDEYKTCGRGKCEKCGHSKCNCTCGKRKDHPKNRIRVRRNHNGQVVVQSLH